MGNGNRTHTSYVCAPRTVELGILSFVQKTQLDQTRRSYFARLIYYINKLKIRTAIGQRKI